MTGLSTGAEEAAGPRSLRAVGDRLRERARVRRWTLQRRVTALGVLVGIVLSLLAAAGAGVAAANRTQIDFLVDRATPLRANAERLLVALVDQETAIRGYAVTGDAAELAPYRSGLAAEQELAGLMDGLLVEQPAIRQQLVRLRERADQWRAAVALPVLAAVRDGGPEAAQALITESTRRSFDEVRAAAAALQESVVELRDEAARTARQTGNALMILLLSAIIVVVAAGVGLVVLLRRLIIDPVAELAGQVRQVADGSYQRAIVGSGPPEVVRLAGDVEGMRRRIAADLDEVRQAQQQVEEAVARLEEQAEELTRSNRDLEQFAYVASHDLQEPLRKVASFCQLLQRRYAGQLDERADQYIAFAVDGAQRMQRLINDLLAFSRIGRLTAGFTTVDLNQVMDQVASQTQPLMEYANGELAWSDLPTVRGEDPLLTTLLVNLVSNAVKFRRPETPPRIVVTGRRVGDEWEISCADNGIGIGPEFSDKVFVIFQRLHSKDAYPGTGIGLAIAKKIVEYHGGRIWVDPEVEVGATIRFTLPVTEEAQP